MPAYHRRAGRDAATVRQEHWQLEVFVPRHATLLSGWLQPHRLEQPLPRLLPAFTEVG